jgi:hypothetical protein
MLAKGMGCGYPAILQSIRKYFKTIYNRLNILIMKKIGTLTVFMSLWILNSFAQFEVIAPSGNDGVGLNLKNTSGFFKYQI